MKRILKMIDGTSMFCSEDHSYQDPHIIIQQRKRHAEFLLNESIWVKNIGFDEVELETYEELIHLNRTLIESSLKPKKASGTVGRSLSQIMRWMPIIGSVIVVICLFLFAYPRWIKDIKDQLRDVFCCDASIYYGIGKGLTKGYKLYTDLFDIKPPGIFWLSALSYSLFGGFYPCVIVSYISTLIPLIAVIVGVYKKTKQCITAHAGRILCLLCMIPFGGMLLFYTHSRSGHMQVEAIGSSFIIGFYLLIRNLDSEKTKIFAPRILLASLVLMLGPMFKEPFAIVGTAVALMCVNNLRDGIKRMILPLLYGGIAGVVILLISGDLFSFIGIYLNYMFSSMLGGALKHSFEIYRLVLKAWAFSPFFAISLIIGSVIIETCNITKAIKNRTYSQSDVFSILWAIFKLPIAIWLTSLAVGSTGTYFPHHFVFAIPLYTVIIIQSTEILLETKGVPYLSVACVILAIASIIAWPKFDMYETGIIKSDPQLQKEAAHVDKILDQLGEEQYQYYGFNGDTLYLYTDHIPLGPIFMQDSKKISSSNFIGINLMDQLNKSNVVVVQTLKCAGLTEKIQDILDTEFTTAAPEGIDPTPEDFICKIYYRKTDHVDN